MTLCSSPEGRRGWYGIPSQSLAIVSFFLTVSITVPIAYPATQANTHADTQVVRMPSTQAENTQQRGTIRQSVDKYATHFESTCALIMGPNHIPDSLPGDYVGGEGSGETP